MNYDFEIKNIESLRVAYISFNGVVSEANKLFPSIFKSIKGNANGSPFFNYYKMDPKTQNGEIKVCVPTAETPSVNGVEIEIVPSIKALCTTHIGPYKTLFNAYEAVYAYAKENNLSLKSPFREVYIKGPGMILKGNPNKYITEIIFPLKEE